jgi:MFS superfamily sulfate permease-like transporter/CRP-like cAMP-binding protein
MNARALLLDKVPGLGRYYGDIVGGLISAGVAIPLAMGYGMFAFIVLGNDYFPDGALAGLLTAAVVGIACVAMGDKSANVYAPRVITTFFIGILLYGLVHSDAQSLKAGGLTLILAVLFAMVILAGAFQALFGLTRLGTVIRFIPQPVMSGFQNAAALLLLLVQLGNLFGFDKSTTFVNALKDVQHAKPLSLLIAAISIVAMLQARRWLPKVPALLLGIAAGTLLYYILGLAGLGSHLGPTIGSAPFSAYKVLNIPHFADLSRTPGLFALVPTIIAGAFALAIVASIDALLCSKLVTQPGDPKVDGDRLLVRLGVANIVSGSLGGITGGLNIGPSRLNKAAGARTPVSALVNGFAVLLTLLVLFPALAFLPCVALSAVIVVIAVEHFDPWTMRLARRVGARLAGRKGMLDLVVVAVVAIVAVVFDIVFAVFAGITIAALMFVVRVGRSVIRRMYRCTGVRSRTRRTVPEIELLEKRGALLLAAELQGALFFGSGERLAGQIFEQVRKQETRYVVLDLRRVTEIDSTGAQILLDIQSELALQGRHLVLALVQSSDAAGHLAELGVVETLGKERVFPDLDRALEWAEDHLLRAEAAEAPEQAEMPLRDTSIAAGFSASELATIEKHFERRVFEPGRELFREGEAGNELLVIAKGSANAFLRQPAGGDMRLVTFGPGTSFGELAILDEGPRSASVTTQRELVCYALSKESFATLSAKAPATAIKLLANLSRLLSYRLREANRTIQQLEE